MALAGGDYEIRIKGRLSDALLAAFEDLTTTLQPVATVLHGPVQDQAALYRLLQRIQSLGRELVEIRQLPAAADEVQPSPSTNRQIRRLVLSVHPVRLSAVSAGPQSSWSTESCRVLAGGLTPGLTPNERGTQAWLVGIDPSPRLQVTRATSGAAADRSTLSRRCGRLGSARLPGPPRRGAGTCAG
jgi:hypothetical protein